MFINHNMQAVRTNSQLALNTKSMNKSLERLSSGYRINKAADDSAGMAIARKMKTQIAALEQSSRNASDGISVIQTAEGALTEVHNMLQRMRELSVQAANGTLTVDDRQAIQDEIKQLNSEIDRISTDTEFNTKTLLDGSLDRKSHSSDPYVSIMGVNERVPAGDYIINVMSVPEQAEYKASAGTAFTGDGGTVKGTEAGTITINGESVTINEGDTRNDVVTKLRSLCSRVDVNMEVSNGKDFVDDEAAYTFTSLRYGKEEALNISCSSTALATALGIDTKVEKRGVDAEVSFVTSKQVEANPTTYKGKESLFTDTTTVNYEDSSVIISDYNGFSLTLDLESMAKAQKDKKITIDKTAGRQVTIGVFDAGSMVLQVGANEHQTLNVSIPEVSTKTLGIDDLNVLSDMGAQKAIGKVDAAVNKVSEVRAKLGAYQNRLESSISNVDTSALNLDEALSRIEDIDMAEEMTKYTQYQVLVQASTSMLAQANEQPQTVLSLLQG